MKNHSKTLITAQEISTAIQIDVNAVFFHIELGIKAGLERRSCRPTQRIKAGTRASDIVRRAILLPSLILASVPVMALCIWSANAEGQR